MLVGVDRQARTGTAGTPRHLHIQVPHEVVPWKGCRSAGGGGGGGASGSGGGGVPDPNPHHGPVWHWHSLRQHLLLTKRWHCEKHLFAS